MEFRGAAPSEYETPTFVPGRKGLNWHLDADQIDAEEALYRRNLVQNRLGELACRDGQTQQLAGIGSVHSIQRLTLPASSSATRFWGGGTTWYRGALANTVLEGGFSGDPL